MGLMDFFIRPEPVSYGTAKGLNTLQINRIAADLRTARDKVNNQMAKRELLEKQREAAVKVKTEAEEQLGVFGLVQILLQKTSDYARQQVKVRIVKFTSADSRYSIQQRKANTRNVIESVYGSEKDYQFGCAFIRSLHGEKKKGDNDYDRVPCAGDMCPCIKGNTDVAEEAINLPLAKTSDASLTGKLITTRVMVAGKKHTPYVVPKKVEYSCWGQEKCKKYGCPLLNIPTATAYKELNAHNRELIQMTETGDDNIKGILREISGIPSCGKYDTSIVETINVDELLVIPMAEEDGVKEDDTGSYVLRKIYAIGGMKIETNKYYEISGYMYPHPKNQESTILVTNATPLQDVVESFSLTEEVREELDSLRPESMTVENIVSKLGTILNDLTYGKTRKEVADKLREAQNKLDAGVIPGGDNVLFSTWVMNWLEIVIKPGIKERTYVNYKASIEKHIIPGIGRYKLKDITDDVIQKYLNDQQEHGNLKLEINDDTGEAAPSHGPVAASSLIQQRRLIIAALEYAVDKGRINRNPGKKTRRPKSKPKTNNILTDEEMETLGIKGTKYRYYPAYMLTLTTACRRGEILGLDWQHVDIGIPWTTVDRYFPWGDIKKLPKWDTKALKTLLEDHNITLGDGYLRLVYQMVDDNGTPFRDELKTDLSRRSLMITEEMVLLLIFWRLVQNTEKRKATERGIEYNPDNLVFCTRKGTYIYPRNFTKMWSENLRSMGIDHKRFHDLRHTVATVMLEDGEAMNTVQEQLGHYDAGFTASRYGHVTAKMRNSAAVKLGERLEKVRNPEAEEDANSVKKEDTVIPFQEGRKLKSAACKIK